MTIVNYKLKDECRPRVKSMKIGEIGILRDCQPYTGDIVMRVYNNILVDLSYPNRTWDQADKMNLEYDPVEQVTIRSCS